MTVSADTLSRWLDVIVSTRVQIEYEVPSGPLGHPLDREIARLRVLEREIREEYLSAIRAETAA